MEILKICLSNAPAKPDLILRLNSTPFYLNWREILIPNRFIFDPWAHLSVSSTSRDPRRWISPTLPTPSTLPPLARSVSAVASRQAVPTTSWIYASSLAISIRTVAATLNHEHHDGFPGSTIGGGGWRRESARSSVDVSMSVGNSVATPLESRGGSRWTIEARI